jgi:phage-related protein
MAVFKSLTFDGINSLDYGIYITGEAVYNAPERVVEMVSVPGRNGNIAIDQGRFENIEVTYPAGCFADSQADFADKVMRFRNALASRYTYKRLTDEYHSDEYRLGLYKSGLDVDAVRYGTAGQFDITFDCKPQRFLLSGETAVTPSDYGNPNTETGEIVTIDSDGSLGVKSLEVSLSPIQDLNGYDKPWVGGAGRNMIDPSQFPKAGGGGAAYFSFPVSSDFASKLKTEGGAIKVECTLAEGKNQIQVYGYDGSNNEPLLFGSNSVLNSGNNFTLSGAVTRGNNRDVASITEIRLYVQPYNVSAQSTITAMYLQTGTDEDWTPYENICPISGRTEVNTIVSPTTSATDGRTYTTALGRTVYGGTLDVVSGELTVDKAYALLNDASKWVAPSGSTVDYRYNEAFTRKFYNDSFTGLICSIAQVRSGSSVSYTARWTGAGSRIFGIVDRDGLTSLDEIKQLASNNEIAICYDIEPQTYQLTPQQVDLLLGINHLWSDGEITVEYGVHPYYNPTQFESKPLIVVTGKGVLQIGDYVLTIVGRENQTIYIDCESQEAWEVVGAGRISRNDYIQNAGEEFPVLVPGINNISVGSGITAVTITPRWWRI